MNANKLFRCRFNTVIPMTYADKFKLQARIKFMTIYYVIVVS